MCMSVLNFSVRGIVCVGWVGAVSAVHYLLYGSVCFASGL